MPMIAMAIGTSTRMPPGFLEIGCGADCEPADALLPAMVDAIDVNAIIPNSRQLSAPADFAATPAKLLMFS